jgi:ribosomal protein S18 acetylase RimI-like enzyme
MGGRDRCKAAEMETISWYDGDRNELRPLFELADDSPTSLDRSIGSGRVLVARDGTGTIIGHLQLLPGLAPETHEIKNLAVRERDQGRGVGRRLVEHALAVCREEGGHMVTVVTAMADIGNLRFYQRCGFRAVEMIPDAFTPAGGYPPDLVADGIPVLDAIRFAYDLSEPGLQAAHS